MSIIVFVQTENYTTTNYFLRSKCSLLQNCKQSIASDTAVPSGTFPHRRARFNHGILNYVEFKYQAY